MAPCPDRGEVADDVAEQQAGEDRTAAVVVIRDGVDECVEQAAGEQAADVEDRIHAFEITIDVVGHDPLIGSVAARDQSAIVAGRMRIWPCLALVLAGCSGFHSMARRSAEAAAGDSAGAKAGLAEAVSPSPGWRAEWQSIGASHKGRPLRMTRLGRGPRRVLWIGGIHGDEREGSVSTAELPHLFLGTPGAAQAVTLTILEDVNPDGTAQNTRGNSLGIDLNRNYPAGNFKPSRFFGARPLDQPEARALHDLILAERPHLVIVAHGWRNDHFINYDGPALALAERFSRLSGYRVQPSNEIAPTPGSLGSWVGGTLKIPILTLEHQRGRDPWAAWLDTRAAIMSVVMEP